MGFMDKAKKLAEQAQAKLDEAQGQFNAKQGGGATSAAGAGSAVEYDQHGRPVPTSTLPPVAAPAPAPPPVGEHDPGSPLPPAPPSPPPGDEDAYAPPRVSSGDPLAG